jgi:glyoxylase-like metal-dependent hydrolase (beta-lactamase superfamily II)
MKWEKIQDSLWVFRDSCNVYAVQGPSGIVLVNAGSGKWLDYMGELPSAIRSVACTHFFRDHTAGAAIAAERGIDVYAPYWEKEQFSDPLGLFQRRETYLIYDNIWDSFAPIRPIAVKSWLRDWEVREIEGIAFETLPTPGMTIGAISLACTIKGRRIIFCGETIRSPGKISRIAPLQYNYADLPGAVILLRSARLLRKQAVDLLAPSIGDPIVGNAKEALLELELSLSMALKNRPEYHANINELDAEPLIRISDHIYRSRFGVANTWFIISDSKKALAIDYGYHAGYSYPCYPYPQHPNYPYPRHRRAMLHGIDGLKEMFHIEKIDTVIVTHFHDDHVSGIPLLQRLFNTRAWAGEHFAFILSHPMGYNFPATWYEEINIEPKPLYSSLHWEEYIFTLFPISGHTRWSNLIAFEADGMKIVATGDQYLWVDLNSPGWLNFTVPGKGHYMQNHVYRNGCDLNSLHDSNDLIRSIGPDLILPGHGDSFVPDKAFYKDIVEYSQEYVQLHKRIMALDDFDMHLDVDSRAAYLVPYRIHLVTAEEIELLAHVKNLFNRDVAFTARLLGPEGWKSMETNILIEARGESTVRLQIQPPENTICRRQPVALELVCNDAFPGQVAEALITIGYPSF